MINSITLAKVKLVLLFRNFSAEETIAKREEALDYIVPLPHELPGISAKAYDGTFPELNEAVLEGSIVQSPLPSPWKQRHRRLRPKLLEVSIFKLYLHSLIIFLESLCISN